jgi:hypothetical protein
LARLVCATQGEAANQEVGSRAWYESAFALHAIWVATQSDTERDELLGDATFKPECLEVLARCGYPQDALLFVGVAIQSQQTVDRKSGSSWFMAMK